MTQNPFQEPHTQLSSRERANRKRGRKGKQEHESLTSSLLWIASGGSIILNMQNLNTVLEIGLANCTREVFYFIFYTFDFIFLHGKSAFCYNIQKFKI